MRSSRSARRRERTLFSPPEIHRLSRMPSFDVVSQLNLQEVDNALNQARKEVAQRYDFKDTRTVIDWDKKEKISIESADEFKVKAVDEVLTEKLARRQVPFKAVE